MIMTKTKAETSLPLDYEVTSARPTWVTITLPDGSQYQASIVTSVVGVKTKPGSGDVSFDFEINWQARWEKV